MALANLKTFRNRDEKPALTITPDCSLFNLSFNRAGNVKIRDLSDIFFMPSLILFNKPYDVICQFSKTTHEKSLADYIALPEFYPAGRLDKNSEGLVILTNNGQLQHRLSHPKHHKKKYYWVQVEGIPTEMELAKLRKGLIVGKTRFLPAQINKISEPELWPRVPPIRVRQYIPTSWLEIILSEGKNHQVRKMTAAIGYPTLRLVRYKIAEWLLGDLEPGQYIVQNLQDFDSVS